MYILLVVGMLAGVYGQGLVSTRIDFNPQVNQVEANVIVRSVMDELIDTIPVTTRAPFSVRKNLEFTGPAKLTVDLQSTEPPTQDPALEYETVEPVLEKRDGTSFTQSVIRMKRRIDIIDETVKHPNIDRLLRVREWIALFNPRDDIDSHKASIAMNVTRELAKLRATLAEKAADYDWLDSRAYTEELGPRQLRGYLREYLDFFLHEFDYNQKDRPAIRFGEWIAEDPTRRSAWSKMLDAYQRAYPATPIVTNPNTDAQTTTNVFELIDASL